MRHEVTDADTAIALGSGDVPVLGTPRLIAWLEAATVQAAAPHCGPGETSVGTAVRIEHLRATPVRGSVTVEAVLSSPPARSTGWSWTVSALWRGPPPRRPGSPGSPLTPRPCGLRKPCTLSTG